MVKTRPGHIEVNDLTMRLTTVHNLSAKDLIKLEEILHYVANEKFINK